jgi:hypothetical protein
MIWLYISAILMSVTAIIHSWAGEKRLIGPILATGPTAIPTAQSRRVLRLAWHLTSAFMLTIAAVVAWPDVAAELKTLVAVFWLMVGLFALISSRGKHVGWPSLTLAGIAALVGIQS